MSLARCVSSNTPRLGSGKAPVPPMLYSPVLWNGVSTMRLPAWTIWSLKLKLLWQ